MKQAVVVSVLAVAVGVIAAVWLWPSHRLPKEQLWILNAPSAQLFEMDTVYEEPGRGEPLVGEYSKKPFLGDVGLPQHYGWKPVAGPNELSGADLEAFQTALTVFDAESDRRLNFDCSFEPRTCLRFQSDHGTVDVFVCVYCRSLVVQDASGKLIGSGDLHGSYRLFVEAVAKHLSSDEHFQKVLSDVRSGKDDTDPSD